MGEECFGHSPHVSDPTSSPRRVRVLEGQDHLNMLMKTTRNIAIEILGSVPPGGLDEAGATIVLNAIRRLKLYYYAVVEHLRSNDSYATWLEAH